MNKKLYLDLIWRFFSLGSFLFPIPFFIKNEWLYGFIVWAIMFCTGFVLYTISLNFKNKTDSEKDVAVTDTQVQENNPIAAIRYHFGDFKYFLVEIPLQLFTKKILERHLLTEDNIEKSDRHEEFQLSFFKKVGSYNKLEIFEFLLFNNKIFTYSHIRRQKTKEVGKDEIAVDDIVYKLKSDEPLSSISTFSQTKQIALVKSALN